MTRPATTILRTLVAIFIAVAAPAATASVTTITLHASLRLPRGEPVTLGDLAEIEGPQAGKLARIPAQDLLDRSRPDAFGWHTVDTDDLRTLLESTEGLNWGRLTIRGSTAQIRLLTPPGPAPTLTPRETTDPQRPAPPKAGTVRSIVVAQLRAILAVAEDDLAVDFDTRHDDLLDRAAAGFIVEARPIGSGQRTPIEVVLYDGDQITARETIRADVRIRRAVTHARVAIRKGEPITADHLATEVRWVGPDEAPIDPTAAVGQRARGHIAAGATIEPTMIESPIVIRRGDLVVVHCVTPTVVIRQQARATADARAGETVTLELPATGRRLTARADGPGRAVVRPADTFGVVRTGPIDLHSMQDSPS